MYHISTIFSLRCAVATTRWLPIQWTNSRYGCTNGGCTPTRIAHCTCYVCLFIAGRAAVTLTSSVDHVAACPGEVVVYTCTAPRTSSVGWLFPPDINNELDYFASSPLGQVQVFGDSQVVLTSRIPDPNTPGLADLTTTLTVTATPVQHGRMVTCEGDEPSEILSSILSITSEHTFNSVTLMLLKPECIVCCIYKW